MPVARSRVILGVFGIGVDLAFAREREARCLGQFHHVIGGQVAVLFVVLGGGPRLGAVIDHTQRAARLQHVIKRLEGRALVASTTQLCTLRKVSTVSADPGLPNTGALGS